MTASLHYTGAALDRCDNLRRDSQRISALWSQPDAIILPVFQLQNLVDERAGNAVMAARSSVQDLVKEIVCPTFLGMTGGRPVFSVLCESDCAARWESISRDYCFSDLRKTGPGLPHEQASILAYARGISHWQQLNRYCAACGLPAELRSAGHMLICSSADCGRQWFPRTDPAVIMLIERVDKAGSHHCLLGRSAQWPKGVYSTLAGFVETGESLEQAVIREVYEEAGIVVEDVRYVASQPWPFPQSLMVGFIGTAVTEDITVDTTELAEARWFEAQEIASFGNWGDNTDGPKLPRPDSIARFLIDQWRSSVCP